MRSRIDTIESIIEREIYILVAFVFPSLIRKEYEEPKTQKYQTLAKMFCKKDVVLR